MFDAERTDVGQKVNGFIDIKGKPYLLGYYLNSYRYQDLDSSVLSSGISLDTSVNNLAVININIDQTDHSELNEPLLKGNAEKRDELEQMVMANREFIAHNRFSIIKKGLVARINYRLESQRSGRVIKTVTENLVIYDSGYYHYSEGAFAADPALVVNYSDSVISMINQYTHGVDPLVIRINTVHLFYEVVPGYVRKPKQRDSSMITFGYPVVAPACSSPRFNHRLDGITRYYNFGSNNSDIFLNQSEIDSCKFTELVPCGSFYINKAFTVVPNQRIVFKLSVWKNDLTVVSDTYRLANILGIYAFDTFGKAQSGFANAVLDQFESQQISDDRRDQIIQMLQAQINELRSQMEDPRYITSKPKRVPPDQTRDIPKCTCKCHHMPPPPPPIEHHCECHCHDHFEEFPPRRPYLRPDFRRNLFIEDLERIVDEHMD